VINENQPGNDDQGDMQKAGKKSRQENQGNKEDEVEFIELKLEGFEGNKRKNHPKIRTRRCVTLTRL